jgi:hypothetical protein
VAGEEKEHTLGDSTSLRWLGVNYRASDGWKAKVTREHPGVDWPQRGRKITYERSTHSDQEPMSLH